MNVTRIVSVICTIIAISFMVVASFYSRPVKYTFETIGED